METVELKATSREKGNKGIARRLRSSGKIPAVCYGSGTEVLEIAFEAGSLQNIVEGPFGKNTRIRLNIDEGSVQRDVMIKDVQKHPVTRRFLHVDFYAILDDKPVLVEVPIRLVGQSIGVKRGGKMRQVARTVLVRCLPADVPAEILCDVTKMRLKERRQISQIPVPEGLSFVYENDFAVAQVISPRADNLIDDDDDEEETAEVAADE